MSALPPDGMRISLSPACLAPTAINRMPFFVHFSGFTMKYCHIYEVGGDCVNINFVMPTESTGWFGISRFQWCYWTKCPERIVIQLLGKWRVCGPDKSDEGVDGFRKRCREVHDETSDNRMVCFLSWFIHLFCSEVLFYFIDPIYKGHRLAKTNSEWFQLLHVLCVLWRARCSRSQSFWRSSRQAGGKFSFYLDDLLNATLAELEAQRCLD